MAAVAREPGAAAVLTVPPPEPRPPDPACSGPSLPSLPPEPPGPRLCAAFGDKDEDRRHVSIEANANELQSHGSAPELTPLLRDSAAGKGLSDHGPGAEQDPVQSAVSPLSLPAAPEAPEAGLSLGQPNGPDRACTERTMTGSPDRTEPAASRFTALREPAEPRREDREEDGGEQAADRAQEPAGAPGTESGPELQPGTQVRVSLDHVIDDALVVSFRVGHKVFSGVLMDLSRRFGPYGIPISTFPPRRESSRRHVTAADAPPPPSADVPPPDPALTPLFHQGAPYPPPLFLRDSYHQSLPQPPPRRIKRSRRRYGNSEEPTCMLVRLRPRQVLCDRCKGPAGPRPAPSARRRPNPEPLDENLPAEVKRLRCDDPRPPRPRRDTPKGPAAGAPNPAPRRPTGRDHRTRDGTRSSSLRSAPGSLRSGPGSGLRSGPDPGLRSNSGGASGSRVLTRRISSALSPPRIRLKPHRYRTDPEPSPPAPKTRPRPGPGPRLDPGPQRTSKNSAKTQTKPSSRAQNRLQNRDEARPRSKPGPKAETRPGLRTEPKEVKSECRPESENRTKTLFDQDPDHPEENPKRVPKPEPETGSCSDPDLKPVLPGPSPSRSRRKQVFPRPNRDFDLDFIGWCGPDPDQDQTRPGQDRSCTKPGLDPKPDTERNETKSVCEEKSHETQLRSGEPGPEPDQRPISGPKPDLRPRPGPEPDPESGSYAATEEKRINQGPGSVDGSEVQSRSSPGPESLKSSSGQTEPGVNLEFIKLDHEPEHRTITETEPEPMEVDSNLNLDQDPGPDHIPDQVPSLDPDLPETGSKDSPDPTVRSRSGSVVDSRPSSPGSSSGSRSRPSSRTESRASEQSQCSTRSRTESRASGQSQCSTRSRTESVCKPQQKNPDEKQKLSQSPGPRPESEPDSRPESGPDSRPESGPDSRPESGPDSRPESGPDSRPESGPDSRPESGPDSRPDHKPDHRPVPSRAVPKVVGADGRCVCVGDIVWAKIAGFPWWPARVLSLTVCRRGDGGGAAKQEVRVAWFGSRTTSVLPLSHTSSFLETFQARFDRKRRGPYRRAIAEAASAAKQLTPEVRALITQFET